jgi:hypothetical protein
MVPSNKSVKSANPITISEASIFPCANKNHEPSTTIDVPNIVIMSGVIPILSSPRQSGVINLTTAGFMRELIIGTS